MLVPRGQGSGVTVSESGHPIPSAKGCRLRTNGRSSGALRTVPAIVPLDLAGEVAPRRGRRLFDGLLRDLGRRERGTSTFPSKVEPGPLAGQRGEHVIDRQRPVGTDAVRVPSVRRLQGDDVPGPIPALVRVHKVLEHDPARGTFDDLAGVTVLLPAVVVRVVVRAPGKHVDRKSTRDRRDVVLGTGPSHRLPRHGGSPPYDPGTAQRGFAILPVASGVARLRTRQVSRPRELCSYPGNRVLER